MCDSCVRDGRMLSLPRVQCGESFARGTGTWHTQVDVPPLRVMAAVVAGTASVPPQAVEQQWVPPPLSAQVPCELFELFGPTLPSYAVTPLATPATLAAAGSSQLAPSLVPLPRGLLSGDSIAAWKRTVQTARRAAAIGSVTLTNTTGKAAQDEVDSSGGALVSPSSAAVTNGSEADGGHSVSERNRQRRQLLLHRARVSSDQLPSTTQTTHSPTGVSRAAVHRCRALLSLNQQRL